MNFEFIIVEPQVAPGVGLIRLNRPKELNALNRQVIAELVEATAQLDQDTNCRCIVLTGNERAFAAGADIKEMSDRTATEMLVIDQFSRWEAIRKTKKPIIAAVSGFALGGGCELCMLCDIIIAGDSAQFGQPEIKIGVIPGAGGTQRLTRAIGKYRAMELILTGKFISAEEAYRIGLVNRIVPTEIYLQEAIKLAQEIATMPPVAVRLAKEAVNTAEETLLDDGLLLERKNFYLLFATEDQKEGMKAFIEKRAPNWQGK